MSFCMATICAGVLIVLFATCRSIVDQVERRCKCDLSVRHSYSGMLKFALLLSVEVAICFHCYCVLMFATCPLEKLSSFDTSCVRHALS